MLPELPLIDSFGRLHNNLRISVTDRCNIRCFYCMPAEDVQFMEKSELLTFEEIERFVRIAVPLGIDKLRLTGGEPLVRRELKELVSRLAAIDGIKDIGLTTNGILLADQAEGLYQAGLRRINVSLDALTPEKFKKFTRREGFERVIEGIQAAQQAGFQPVKINAVSVRGMTEEELVPFGHFAREMGVEVRFIEYMPLDADNAWERGKVLYAHEIVERLSAEIMPLRSLDPDAGDGHGGPATDFVFEDGIGRIGFISSVSQPFCMSCNRIRITADGKLRNCLFSLDETDVRSLLRSGAADQQIVDAIRASVAAKKEGHEINTARFIQPARPMHSIGG
ncbi:MULTISPECIES: GTP 3',8-cyclase MoaA [unclassified Schlesneria]|uniref:GTP 3',8-cyclase MoaA n=1 Tax=Schlesneria TaxID=656899 RepID=UPI00359FAB01